MMSIKRLAVVAAVSAFANNSNTSTTMTYYNVTGAGGNGSAFGIRRGQHSIRPGSTLHGNVNILLGGAMLSVVISIVSVVCYCCHRSIRKRTSLYRQRWLENDSNIEIYSVEQCYETSGLFLETSEGLPNSIHLPGTNHGEPPPSYDVVLAMDQVVNPPSPPPRYHSNENNNQFKDGGSIYSSHNNGNLYNNNSNNNNIRHENSDICQFSSGSLERGELMGAGAHGSHKPRIVGSSNENFYYSGCPLCGKFQYTSPSIDSGFENVFNADVENGNEGSSNCDCPSKDFPAPSETAMPLTDTNADCLPTNNANSIESQLLDLNSNPLQSTVNNNNNDQFVDSSGFNAANESGLRGNELESINDGGIIRLDMSRIIDKTGLPSYEAALKLESSGYV